MRLCLRDTTSNTKRIALAGNLAPGDQVKVFVKETLLGESIGLGSSEDQ